MSPTLGSLVHSTEAIKLLSGFLELHKKLQKATGLVLSTYMKQQKLSCAVTKSPWKSRGESQDCFPSPPVSTPGPGPQGLSRQEEVSEPRRGHPGSHTVPPSLPCPIYSSSSQHSCGVSCPTYIQFLDEYRTVLPMPKQFFSQILFNNFIQTTLKSSHFYPGSANSLRLCKMQHGHERHG